MLNMNRILLVLILIVLLPSVLLADWKVYVVAHHDGEFISSQRLIDSTKDLKASLSKRKGITIVDNEAAADLTIEVLSADTIATQINAASVVTQSQLRAVVHVSRSDHSQELSRSGVFFWKTIAGLIADDFMRWLSVNELQLKRQLVQQ